MGPHRDAPINRVEHIRERKSAVVFRGQRREIGWLDGQPLSELTFTLSGWFTTNTRQAGERLLPTLEKSAQSI